MTYVNVSTCNTDMSALPDLYAQSQKVGGQRARGIHIKQSSHACVANNNYVGMFVTLCISVCLYSKKIVNMIV